MNRIVFGSDLDDCILVTAPEILKELGKSSYDVLKSINRFSISDCLNLPREVVDHAIDNVLERTDLQFDESFYKTFPRLLKLVGHIYIVTSRSTHLEPGRTILDRIMGRDEYTLVSSSRYDTGIPRKAEIINDYGINFFVEDRFATAVDIVERTNCFVILMSKPWNKRLTKPDRVLRVNNWYEILSFLRKVVKS